VGVSRAVAVATISGLLLLAVGTAQVLAPAGVTEMSLEPPSSTTSWSPVDQACAGSVPKTYPEMTIAEVSDYCGVFTEFAVSESEEVMLSTGSVWSRTWSQDKTGPGWQEKHTGKFYYDGTRVWSTTQYRGLEGYHVCDQGYGLGFIIEVTKCAVDGGASTSELQIWDDYEVHAFLRGFPISNPRGMHITVDPSGNTSLYWSE
jgi:hypothetical protein